MTPEIEFGFESAVQDEVRSEPHSKVEREVESEFQSDAEWANADSVSPQSAQTSAATNCMALLWRQRKFLGRMMTAGGLSALVIALLTPNRYESTTRLMSPDMRGNASQALMSGLLSQAGGLAGLGANLLGVDNTGGMFMGVLHSRTVAEHLIKRFDLKRVYRDRRDQDAWEDLADRTFISEDHKSQIISISIEDTEPRRAADLAAAYVDELNRLLVEVNTSSAHRERVFIEERLQVIRPELDVAAKQLSDFSSKNTTLDPKEQGKAMVGAVVNMQGELIANETELRGLQQIYSDNNVRVRSLQARIGELRHQLQQLRGNGTAAVAGAEDAGDGGVSSYPSFRQLPALGVTYADLYREVRLREVVFESLTQQYEMAKIAEAKEIPSVKVLDPANLPEKKSGPHRAQIVLTGIVLSALFGSILVVARSLWQQVDRDDPRKRLTEEIGDDMRHILARWRELIGKESGHDDSKNDSRNPAMS